MALTITGAPGGARITDDTTTNATRYPLFDDVTTGASTSIGTSSTKLTFNPSTGVLSATAFTGAGTVAGTGTNKAFVETDTTISQSYSISSGKNAMTTGPITINSGVTVTVPNGSRWLIL